MIKEICSSIIPSILKFIINLWLLVVVFNAVFRYMEENPRYQQEGISMSDFSFQPPVPLDEKYLAKRRASTSATLDEKHLAKRRASTSGTSTAGYIIFFFFFQIMIGLNIVFLMIDFNLFLNVCISVPYPELKNQNDGTVGSEAKSPTQN